MILSAKAIEGRLYLTLEAENQDEYGVLKNAYSQKNPGQVSLPEDFESGEEICLDLLNCVCDARVFLPKSIITESPKHQATKSNQPEKIEKTHETDENASKNESQAGGGSNDAETDTNTGESGENAGNAENAPSGAS